MLAKKIFVIFLFISLFTRVTPGYAQSSPVISQFSFNPYLYNPAFAGSEGYLALYLAHRMQWIGIEGAPVTSAVAIHTPVARTFALGGQLRQRTNGALTEQTAYISPVYIIPFGEQHNLRFGLSGGATQRSINLQDASAEQQTYLANYTTRSIQWNFQFGINYAYKNFTLGLALPTLNKQYIVGLDNQSEAFDIQPFEEYLASASYFWIVKDNKLALEPSFIYHQLNEASTRMEAGLMLHAGGLVMAGATYRTDYGPSLMLGVNLRKISVGYAYELGNTGLGLGQSTHEIQARLQLGKEKTYSKEIQHRPRFEF